MTRKTSNSDVPSGGSGDGSEQLVPLNVPIEGGIVEALQRMEKHTKIPMQVLVTTALKFFIATHNDYLGTKEG